MVLTGEKCRWGVGLVSDDKRSIAQAAVLRQQQADNRYAVLQFQALTLDIILAQLYLQQVVAHGQTCANSHIHIFKYITQ